MAVPSGKDFRVEIDGKEIQDEVSYDFTRDSDTETTSTKDGDYDIQTSTSRQVSLNVTFNDEAGVGANAANRLLMDEVYNLAENENTVPFRMGGYATGQPFWAGSIKVLSFQHTADAGQVVGYSFTVGAQGALPVAKVT